MLRVPPGDGKDRLTSWDWLCHNNGDVSIFCGFTSLLCLNCSSAAAYPWWSEVLYHARTDHSSMEWAGVLAWPLPTRKPHLVCTSWKGYAKVASSRAQQPCPHHRWVQRTKSAKFSFDLWIWDLSGRVMENRTDLYLGYLWISRKHKELSHIIGSSRRRYLRDKKA